MSSFSFNFLVSLLAGELGENNEIWIPPYPTVPYPNDPQMAHAGFQNGQPVIFYDPNILPLLGKDFLSFTFAHEASHFLLNHYTRRMYETNPLNYTWITPAYELEADCLAARILANDAPQVFQGAEEVFRNYPPMANANSTHPSGAVRIANIERCRQNPLNLSDPTGVTTTREKSFLLDDQKEFKIDPDVITEDYLSTLILDAPNDFIAIEGDKIGSSGYSYRSNHDLPGSEFSSVHVDDTNDRLVWYYTNLATLKDNSSETNSDFEMYANRIGEVLGKGWIRVDREIGSIREADFRQTLTGVSLVVSTSYGDQSSGDTGWSYVDFRVYKKRDVDSQVEKKWLEALATLPAQTRGNVNIGRLLDAILKDYANHYKNLDTGKVDPFFSPMKFHVCNLQAFNATSCAISENGTSIKIRLDESDEYGDLIAAYKFYKSKLVDYAQKFYNGNFPPESNWTFDKDLEWLTYENENVKIFSANSDKDLVTKTMMWSINSKKRKDFSRLSIGIVDDIDSRKSWIELEVESEFPKTDQIKP